MIKYIVKLGISFAGIAILINFCTIKIEIVHSFSTYGYYKDLKIDVRHHSDPVTLSHHGRIE